MTIMACIDWASKIVIKEKRDLITTTQAAETINEENIEEFNAALNYFDERMNTVIRAATSSWSIPHC